MVAFFEGIADVNEVSGLDDEHFFVGKVDNFGIFVNVFLTIVVLDVGVEHFLELEVVLQFFIEF